MALLQASSSKIKQRLRTSPPDQRTDRRPKLNNPHTCGKAYPRIPTVSVHDSVERYLSYLRQGFTLRIGSCGAPRSPASKVVHPIQSSWPTDTCRTLSDRHRSVDYHGSGLVGTLRAMIRPWRAKRRPFARLLGINRDSTDKSPQMGITPPTTDTISTNHRDSQLASMLDIRMAGTKPRERD